MADSSAQIFSRYLKPFDGIRALAVAMVLLHHVSYGYLPGGFIGVDIFFVLSGYLITGLLVREWTESGRLRLDLFYGRRMLRILPPVLVLLLLVLVLSPWIKNYEPWEQDVWTSVAAVLFFVANLVPHTLGPLGPTWSLAIEEQFYLVWPWTLILLLTRLRNRTSILTMLGLLVLAGLALRCFLWSMGIDVLFLYRFTPVRLDGLLFGSMAALVSDLPAVRRAVHILGDFRIPEAILILLLGLLPVLNRGATVLYLGGFTLLAFLCTLLVLCAALETRERCYLRLLGSPVAVWIGKRSYGIYLFHFPLFLLLENFRIFHSVPNLLFITLLRLTLAVGFAAASYRWIETPLLRWKDRLHWKQVPSTTEELVLR